MFYIYILKSEKYKRYYVGSCENLSKRLSQHNKGFVKSTKPYLPWKMMYNETFTTLREARKRELQIKSWKKRAAIESLIKTIQGPVVKW